MYTISGWNKQLRQKSCNNSIPVISHKEHLYIILPASALEIVVNLGWDIFNFLLMYFDKLHLMQCVIPCLHRPKLSRYGI